MRVRVRVRVRAMGEADARKLRPLEEQPRLERTAPRDEARGRRRARRACELRGCAEEGEGVRARAWLGCSKGLGLGLGSGLGLALVPRERREAVRRPEGERTVKKRQTNAHLRLGLGLR